MSRSQMRIIREIAIDAPRETVWAVLSEHERMVEWTDLREVVRRRPGSPDPNGSGAVRTLRGKSFVLEEEITAFEAPERMEYVLTEGAPVRRYRGQILLESRRSGTVVAWSVGFEALVPGTGALLRRFFERALDRSIAGLKRHVESESEATRAR